MVDIAAGEFGGVHILVNNAAISSAMVLTPFKDISTETFARLLAVNTTGRFHCCKAVAPLMRQRKAGRIINLTSGTASSGARHLFCHMSRAKGL